MSLNTTIAFEFSESLIKQASRDLLPKTLSINDSFPVFGILLYGGLFFINSIKGKLNLNFGKTLIIAIFAVVFILLPLFEIWKKYQNLKRSFWGRGLVIWEINSNFLSMECKSSFSKISWDQVEKIDKGSNGLILIDKQGNMDWLPFIAFKSSEQIGEFLTSAKTKIQGFKTSDRRC